MGRCLLHINKLDEFKRYLDECGIPHRPGKGPYQVLQVAVPGTGYQVVFRREEMKENFSINDKLEPLVRSFIAHSRSGESRYHFPARRKPTTGVASVNKIREELKEFLDALAEESVERQVEELWDLINSAEGHMRDYENLGTDVWKIRSEVEEKCRARGLYGSD